MINLQEYIFRFIRFIGFKNAYDRRILTPDLTVTEELILEIITEPKFTEFQKMKLVDQYEKAGHISAPALELFIDRIWLIEHLKAYYNNFKSGD